MDQINEMKADSSKYIVEVSTTYPVTVEIKCQSGYEYVTQDPSFNKATCESSGFWSITTDKNPSGRFGTCVSKCFGQVL